MKIWSNLLELVIPKLCLDCGKRISHKESVLCTECEEKLQPITNFCEYCGSEMENNRCSICSNKEFYFDKARSLYVFSPALQSLIHEFKYNEFTRCAAFFARKSKQYFQEYNPFPKIDIIAPVPLHRVKKRSRGFNQSEILTREISREMNLQHFPDLIKRKKFTKTQTKLNREQRRQNVANAFSVNPKREIRNKYILVVDDVFTTGSTVNAISSVLKEHAARAVYIFTIGRA